MADSDVRVQIILVQRPAASTLMELHRLLGLGLGTVRQRIEQQAPLLDQALFGNDQHELSRKLARMLELLEPPAYELHLLNPGEQRSAQTLIPAVTLWNLLEPYQDPEDVPAHRPAPRMELAAVLAQAVRHALQELPGQTFEHLCCLALATSGEALRPYLCLSLHGEEQWDLAGSRYAVFADQYFQDIENAWDAQGSLWDMPPVQAEAEYLDRLATMEEALRILDAEGVFGTGAQRAGRLLLVASMPPDETDTGYARRLNPPGPLLGQWLDEAAEAPLL